MRGKRDPIRRLGDATWAVGTIGVAALSVVYVGLPAANYIDELLFGPRPRDLGFPLLVVWLVIIPNIAAAPFFLVAWASNRFFCIDADEDSS